MQHWSCMARLGNMPWNLELCSQTVALCSMQRCTRHVVPASDQNQQRHCQVLAFCRLLSPPRGPSRAAGSRSMAHRWRRHVCC